jgi:hypothetical protein
MNNAELERQMQDYLHTILDKYQQMSEAANRLQEKTPESMTMAAGDMLLMKERREEIEKLNLASQPLQTEYRATRDHASTAVDQLRERVAAVLQKLMMKIGSLEKDAQSSYDQLKPKIHNGVRAVQMKNAYGKNR